MTYEKCCRNCEYAFLQCNGCATFGDNPYENFKLRKELAEHETLTVSLTGQKVETMVRFRALVLACQNYCKQCPRRQECTPKTVCMVSPQSFMAQAVKEFEAERSENDSKRSKN